MKLNEVLKNLNCEIIGDSNIEIYGIENNSNKIKEGFLFVCIKGFKIDGHEFIEEVIKKGATAIIVDKDYDKIIDGVTFIKCENLRYALAICSANFYNNPSNDFKLIGVTGTKGKTTTTYIIKSILEAAGKKVGLIGTVECKIGNEKIKDSHRTTPESIELQRMFRKMADEKVDYVIMEVSSQALKLERVAGCNFLVGAFSNFSEDHIGKNEHPTMEDYFNSKLKLFGMCKKCFANIDDKKIFENLNLIGNDVTTYGIENKCDYKASNIKYDSIKTEFDINNGKHIIINIPGVFSVYNSLLAISICDFLKIPEEKIKEGIKNAIVPGRSEIFKNELGLNIIIDYAHSPESLKNILVATKAYTKNRLICVFGCGGDRDNRKRPIMGKISGEISDISIITSDNPRTEDPNEIIKQIENGIKLVPGAKYEIIVDRKEAIKRALQIATNNDIIILAGKGHETYQEINNVYIEFDERVVLANIVEEMKKRR